MPTSKWQIDILNCTRVIIRIGLKGSLHFSHCWRTWSWQKTLGYRSWFPKRHSFGGKVRDCASLMIIKSPYPRIQRERVTNRRSRRGRFSITLLNIGIWLIFRATLNTRQQQRDIVGKLLKWDNTQNQNLITILHSKDIHI